MENRKWLILILSSGALAVLLGAFGAHGLKPYMDDTGLQNFQTANRYHFYHTFLALFYCIWAPGNRWLLWGSKAALIGIVLFSGSLYALALRASWPVPSWLGIITPVGGLSFLLAWTAGILKLLKS